MSMNKRCVWEYIFLFLSFSLSACGSTPLPKTIDLGQPPRLGIIGFKITAPIKHLSSIKTTPKDMTPGQETALLDKELSRIENRATEFLVEALKKEGEVEPVVIPEDSGLSRGVRPTEAQIETIGRESMVDAVLYGEIPGYGKMRLLYPILAESLDIAIETVVLGLATNWNPALIFGNIGLELLTNTPIWFGGAFVFGWAFRPVTVEAWVFATSDKKEIWNESITRIVSHKNLKSYPEADRSKKEVQLESSLRKVIDAMAEYLSR